MSTDFLARARPEAGLLGARTYHGRQGRMSERKRRALSEVGPRYLRMRPGDPGRWFGHTAGPLVVEIGFGMGDATAELARARPAERVIACEMHLAGVANLCQLLAESSVDNVVIVRDDALDVLADLPSASVNDIRAYFPDPWPKQGQRHRRLIQPLTVELIADRLAPGGSLSVATDDAGYAAQMVAALGGAARSAGDARLVGGVVARPDWRPETAYERRAITAGRAVIDLRFCRRG